MKWGRWKQRKREDVKKVCEEKKRKIIVTELKIKYKTEKIEEKERGGKILGNKN